MSRPRLHRGLTKGAYGSENEFASDESVLIVLRDTLNEASGVYVEGSSCFKFFLYLVAFSVTCFVSFLYFHSYPDEKVCFPRVGCFEVSGPWSERPSVFNFFPQSPTVINTSFIITSRRETLYSNRLNPGGCKMHAPFSPLRLNDLRNFSWGNGEFIIFIIHGYTDDTQGWMQSLKDAFLSVSDATVVLVDWKFGAAGYYPQVVANTRVVAREIFLFVTHLKRKFPSKRIHLVGHSLGSHIAGYVGKDITYPQSVHQITALDPAFPLFEGFPSEIRLHRMDAQHVLVIHSNVGPWGLGMEYPVGSVDIYLNNGRDQRGCTPMELIIKEPLNLQTSSINLNGFATDLKELLACSHRRAYEILEHILWSLKDFSSNGYLFVAYPMFLEGKYKTVRHSLCSEGVNKDCWVLGWNKRQTFFQLPTSSETSVFFMPTSDKNSFCARFARLEITACPMTLNPLLLLQTGVTNCRDNISLDYITFGHSVNIYKGRLCGKQLIKAWVEFPCEFMNTNSNELTLFFSVSATHDQPKALLGTSIIVNDAAQLCWSAAHLTYFNSVEETIVRKQESRDTVISTNQCFIYRFG